MWYYFRLFASSLGSASKITKKKNISRWKVYLSIEELLSQLSKYYQLLRVITP